jgi:signal transduction histidine kinase
VSATIRQIHPVFVGEVTSVDMRKWMSAEDTTLIEAGMDEYAKDIESSGGHLLNLIKCLLHLSAIESEQHQIQATLLNFHETIQDCTPVFAEKMTRKSISFQNFLKHPTDNRSRLLGPQADRFEPSVKCYNIHLEGRQSYINGVGD